MLLLTLGSSEAGCAWSSSRSLVRWRGDDVKTLPPPPPARPWPPTHPWPLTRPWPPTHAHAHSIVDTRCMKHRQHLSPSQRTARASLPAEPQADDACRRRRSSRHHCGSGRSRRPRTGSDHGSPGGRSAVLQVIWKEPVVRISNQQYEFSTSITGNFNCIIITLT